MSRLDKNKKPLTTRANSYQRAKRVYEIANLRLQGKSHSDITKIATTKYGISAGAASKDIAEAFEKVRSFLDKDIVNVRVLHARRYSFFYDYFVEKEMYKQAHDCLYNIERLIGIHSSKVTFSIEQMLERRKTNTDIYDYSRLEDKELERLKKLYGKVKEASESKR